ncbi:MAG: TPM domain-containing protein [Candidatus Cybelea sp.]
MRPSLWAGLFIACVLPVPAPAADFTVPPVPTRYVTDDAGALSSAAQASVDAELKAYEKSTGHQVIVWVGDTTGDVPLETWTGETAHQWHVGRRGKDDGAILFLFMSDHKVRIEVGYGLEGSLTDADASRIIRDDIVPRMKADDPNGAVSSGVAAMLTTITPSYAGVTPPPAQENTASPNASGFVIAMIAFFGLLVLFFAFVVVMLITRKGAPAAKKGERGSTFWSSGGSGSSSSGGSDDSSSSDDDFSSGGGDFGGGGASGSW